VAGSLGGSTGILEAENILYVGMNEVNELRHETVTMNRRKTLQEESSPDMHCKEDRGKCRTRAVLLWGGCVTGLVVLALAGAAVALTIIFGFVDVCAKSCPTQGEGSMKDMVAGWLS